MNTKEESKIAQTVIILVCGVIAFLLAFPLLKAKWLRARTERIVKDVAKMAQYTDEPDGIRILDKPVDAWGNQLQYTKISEAYGITHIVASGGEDHQINTKDDIIFVEIDYNKSRIFGHWAGQKSKEFLKGFRKSSTMPSKFKDD